MENPGINKRALKHLFGEIEQRKDMWSYTVTVSSVEIYNEVLRCSAVVVGTAAAAGRCLLDYLLVV